MFRTAARAKAPVFVHNRAFGMSEPGGVVESFVEVIGAAAITGVQLHIVHLNSMSLGETPKTLRIVQEARDRGLPVTTEAYPYSAGQTRIESALLDQYEVRLDPEGDDPRACVRGVSASGTSAGVDAFCARMLDSWMRAALGMD